jgi:hypothetical protein
MKWFRFHSGAGTALALFALVLQLAVSFGHLHLHDILSSHQSGILAFKDTARGQTVSPASDQQTAPDELCAICAGMAMLSSGVAAAPPAIAVPAFAQIASDENTASFAAVRVRSSFQARAPPIV